MSPKIKWPFPWTHRHSLFWSPAFSHLSLRLLVLCASASLVLCCCLWSSVLCLCWLQAAVPALFFAPTLSHHSDLKRKYHFFEESLPELILPLSPLIDLSAMALHFSVGRNYWSSFCTFAHVFMCPLSIISPTGSSTRAGAVLGGWYS